MTEKCSFIAMRQVALLLLLVPFFPKTVFGETLYERSVKQLIVNAKMG